MRSSDEPERATTAAAAEEAPGRGRRRTRRREIETRILTAAEEVFAETGFSGATTAAIAERASLPKANLHYYFGTKEALYRTVLERILEMWLATGDQIAPEAEPAEALAAYVAAKVEASRRRPYASKVFANEMLHGAPQLADYLGTQVRGWVDEKAAVLDRWAAEGKIRPIDGRHLFFVLWAATQTYADFDCQVAAVLGRRGGALRSGDYDAATALITHMVLSACGLTPETDPSPPLSPSAGDGREEGVRGARTRLEEA